MPLTRVPGGLLVAIEGIDGAGKTSVATLLAQFCGERGIACTFSKEPTGMTWGKELRRSAKAGRLTLEREIELFALDRRDHVERSIGPALAEGHVVLLDRYYWSSAAYQGSRGADCDAIVARNEAFAPVPHLVLLMDLDAAVGLERIRRRGDEPNLFEALDALNRARQLFLGLSQRHDYATVIDASGALRGVTASALAAFQAALLTRYATTASPEALAAFQTLLDGD